MDEILSPTISTTHESLLEGLTPVQRQAICHEGGPLLVVAGAGTGKTTVITRRIAWLMATQRARPNEILALTFSEKAVKEMEERVDLLVPYGYVDVCLRTFHAFGDQLLREHALRVGLSSQFRVLSKAEQLVFLKQHLFDLPVDQFRPLQDPTRFVEALAGVFGRAKDETVSPEEFLAYIPTLEDALSDASVEGSLKNPATRFKELADCYARYQQLLRESDAVDFGDQVFLATQLLEQHPDVLATVRGQFRYVLVDEFQDTNYAQFRLLQLLVPPTAELTIVADDDQSIYQWRGAALSNILKFLDCYPMVQTIVLTENFRSSQPILDAAYRLIRFNDPDRLEVHRGVDKRLIACASSTQESAHLYVFDTVSSEADWVAKTIREAVESSGRRPQDFAILVRSNREADPFLRALNMAGIPWHFSGSSGLFFREESRLLVSCLKVLFDPEDSLSWYHVASSVLYRCPMKDLMRLLAGANRRNQSLRTAILQLSQNPQWDASVSEEGKRLLIELTADVERLVEEARTLSAGQLLYRWLADRGFFMRLGLSDRSEESGALKTVAKFFDYLRRIEEMGGTQLPELMRHLELFRALGNEPFEEEDAWTDAVQVLTIHKAKGLEFPVVFLVGLVQGRFPTPKRRDPIELPEALIKDLLPTGDYHLQEERRLFYVGMTRAKEQLYLTAAYDYGGKTKRKISQFVLEALNLASPVPAAKQSTARELIERSKPLRPLAPSSTISDRSRLLRLDPHGVDDYLTCPLKYRYSHILRIPVMRHHLVIYGGALHKAIEEFFKQRLKGSAMDAIELLRVFEASWSSEGFLTRQHEDLRLAQGKQILQRFYASQQAMPEYPTLIEEKFRFLLGKLLVVGRWDRVDRKADEVVIVDYKSSDVRQQTDADRRTRESIQLLIYALGWRILHGQLPTRVELRFLESGVIGQTHFTEEDIERAKELLRETAEGILAGVFSPRPQEQTCRWCAFQSICPAAFRAE